MTRVLLAAHPTAGHTNALRAIGTYLLNQGHKVGMAVVAVRLPCVDHWPAPARVAATLPQSVAKDGIEVLPLKFSLRSVWYGARLPQARGYDELELAIKFFTSGIEQQARQIAGHAQKWKADVVVGDYLMPAAMLGAKLSNRPYAALYHSALPFPAKDAPPFGSGLVGVSPDDKEWHRATETLQHLSDFFDKRVAAAARSLGLPFKRKSLLTSPISEELNLLATTPEIEPGLLPIQGLVVMTGPCLPAVKDTDQNDPVFKVPRDGKTRVYVSLGTVFNGQPYIFKSILDGISGLGFQVVVSAGASYDHLIGRFDSHVHIFRRVPQVTLLPTVDVVITHGGNNTVQETLVAGKPMVVVPFGGDQIVNARRVERLGVGISVLPAELSAESIRCAVKTAILPAMVEQARTLGDSLKQYDGTEIAASKILELAAGDTTQSNDASA